MNKDLISESDLRTILDTLSKKYSINIIIENREEKIPKVLHKYLDFDKIVLEKFLPLEQGLKLSTCTDSYLARQNLRDTSIRTRIKTFQTSRL